MMTNKINEWRKEPIYIQSDFYFFSWTNHFEVGHEEENDVYLNNFSDKTTAKLKTTNP